MAQHDYVIDNSTGANVRADINQALLAILSNNQGSSDPSTTLAGMLFFDTNNDLMKMRNEANNDFINLFTATGGPAFPVDGTINSVNIGKGANSVTGNTVLGESALDASVSGENNTAIGKNSLTANTTGANNTSVGKDSLYTNTSGSGLTALGQNALFANTDGNNNTAVGANALDANTQGANNVGVGNNALGANTTGILNTAIGRLSLSSNTTGQQNAALGEGALETNDTGDFNTAIGTKALQDATNADYNSAVGYAALTDNTTGTQNTAVGAKALDACTTADNNTAVGYQALTAATGDNNTALGSAAGDVTTTGDNNTSLGYEADPSSNSASNEVTLGNSSVSAIRCQVQTISALSDERDKTDIIDSEDGLDIINLLRPRKFTWAMREPSANDGKTEIGFIAQEIDAALGDKNDYIGAVYKSNPEKLEASYGKFVPILVKAVQELSAKVTALEAG